MIYGPYWLDPPAAKTEPQYRIHIVTGGKTLCGVASCDLKKNERWVEPRGPDAHLVNCNACRKTPRR